MPLTAGARLGPYEVIALIGAGGMGEVYRARDTRLNRDVALKILSDAFAQNPERLARFKREAQVLASLNHPNIAAIYGFEEADGTNALVMELVEGTTLADRIAHRALPVDEAIAIAQQIANALEAAHELGIVHRDLKPANINVRKDGTVKVLDFGLAKALDTAQGTGPMAQGDVTSSPTIASPITADHSVILGTAAYMSPEQARGQPVDKRADIWAFGVVLYEMLAGCRPFQGGNTTDMLAAVVRDPPDLSRVPVELRRLVGHCLEKDPRKRLRDLGDVWELTARGGTAAASVDPAARRAPSGRTRSWMVATLLVALGSGALAVWMSTRPDPVLEPVRFTIVAPDDHPLSAGTGFMALSPDGRRVAFVTDRGGLRQLWVRDLDALVPKLLPGTEGAWQPSWSADGRFLTFGEFAAVGTLKRVDLLGGVPATLAQAAQSTAAWSPNGVIVFTGIDGRLTQIPAGGGQPIPVTALDRERKEREHLWPIFLPDGRRFVFLAASADPAMDALYLGSLDSAERTRIVDARSSVAYAAGHLFYQRGGTLMVLPFDEKAGRVTGDARPVLQDVHYNAANGRAAFSVSRDGTLAYRRTAPEGTATLAWLDRRGRPAGSSDERVHLAGFNLSPDLQTLAASRRSAAGDLDIWTIDLERKITTRLTSNRADDSHPVWSQDGTHIYFRSTRAAPTGDLYRRAAESDASDELLFASPDDKYPETVSSEVLLFRRNVGDERRTDIWALPLRGDHQPYPVVSTEFHELNAVLSPDGRWLAYQSDESGDAQIYLRPFPGLSPKLRISTMSGSNPAWSRDGRELFYVGPKDLYAVDLSAPGRPGTSRAVFPHEGNWLIQPANQRFLVASDASAAASPITVVLNYLF
jgi:eukaryotic-like serine/threonine-protein kinase